MKIYMMRHGEALDDVEDCYGGIADFPLTDKGRGQAAAASIGLATILPELIYSSPLKRAKETAEIIAKRLGLAAPLIVQDLRERNSYGVLSGVNKEKAKQIFANILSDLKEKPGYSREYIPGCEIYEEFIPRVRQAFDQVISDAVKKQLKTIAIVTHGKFTQALFDDVLKLEQEYDLKLSAMNILEYEPMRASLGKMT